MFFNSSSVEALRWGQACIPGVIFHYAKELDLDLEDIGIIAAIFYAFERSKPLYQTGIKAGQVLQACPSLSKQKLTRRLNRLNKMQILTVKDNKAFAEKEIFIEPLFAKIESLIIRDHKTISATNRDNDYESIIASYKDRIEQLELQLEEQTTNTANEIIFSSVADKQFSMVADFIAEKTGNLLSVKMANELKKWLDELAFTPEFLLCILELCFERQIYNPKEISIIARDIKAYSINSVEGLQIYFSKYIDNEKMSAIRTRQFDPDIMEFGNFTGVDMNADARKNIYYKWRYDWGFSHAMIMKAGEVMCQRTKNGGLEYIDSVLNNWMRKEIRQVDQAEQEVKEFTSKKKQERNASTQSKKKIDPPEYEIYVPPASLESLKSKA